jgi:hypothetical protein
MSKKGFFFAFLEKSADTLLVNHNLHTMGFPKLYKENSPTGEPLSFRQAFGTNLKLIKDFFSSRKHYTGATFRPS